MYSSHMFLSAGQKTVNAGVILTCAQKCYSSSFTAHLLRQPCHYYQMLSPDLPSQSTKSSQFCCVQLSLKASITFLGHFTAFIQSSFRVLHLIFLLQISATSKLQQSLCTVLHLHTPTNCDVSSSDHLQRVLLSIICFEPLSYRPRMYLCLSRPRPFSLHAILISPQTRRVVDESHHTEWSRNPLGLVPLPLAASSCNTQL